jgi:hypothetical protein
MSNHFASTFGVEIECYLPEGTNAQQAASAVNYRLSQLSGSCRAESYNHITRTWWKVVADGSLGDYTRGVEFVSPPLIGEAGLKQVEAVCKALTDLNCIVNKKCGLHVHVGVGANPDIDFLKNLVKLYSRFEAVIDQLMPVSRRASNNMFCRSMTSVAVAALDRAMGVEQVIAAAQGSRHSESRYYKLNLTAYRKHKTVEFRQHSGTLDAQKAVMWTVLCLRMVAAARSPLPALGSAPATNRARVGSKAHVIGQMLLRPEGVTGREICTALNWPSVSIPAQAKAAGLTFTTQRTGREVRYFAVTQTAQTAVVPTTIQGFAQVIDASSEEVAYMTQRVSDLGGSVAWAA